MDHWGLHLANMDGLIVVVFVAVAVIVAMIAAGMFGSLHDSGR